MLLPSAWATDACDHRAGDVEEARAILRHELTHVFHGQNNVTRDFTGMDDAAWFIEGLAVVVSGQLTKERLFQAREAAAGGQAPKSLATMWSGKHKYGFAGSMVQFIENKYGRDTLKSLLPLTSNDDILAKLEISESELLHDWETWLAR